jgi:hypothetical protein
MDNIVSDLTGLETLNANMDFDLSGNRICDFTPVSHKNNVMGAEWQDTSGCPAP